MSGSSPTTGAAKADGGAGAAVTAAAAPGRGTGRSEATDGRLSIVFEILRGRSAGWAIFGVLAGTLLVVMMGTVAQWLGAILIGIGLLAGWALLRTFLFPPGTIVVDDDGVTLPRGHCTRAAERVGLSDVTAAYFLRRSVPWTRAAPVLIIEAGGRAYAYPRDWFVNEAEQRRVIHAILGRIKPEAVAGISATPAARSEEPPAPKLPKGRVL